MSSTQGSTEACHWRKRGAHAHPSGTVKVPVSLSCPLARPTQKLMMPLASLGDMGLTRAGNEGSIQQRRSSVGWAQRNGNFQGPEV